MQRTLITGANGFVGRHLCETLQHCGHHVIAMSSAGDAAVPYANQTIGCDIRDAEALGNVMAATSPTHVVHLAAISHIPTSFENPLLTWQTNVMGSVNLIEAVRSFTPDAFVLFVSSADIYGAAFKANVPLAESATCLPQNPYAASKLAAEAAFAEAFRRGLRGVVARPFNHIGARQSPSFATAGFARQIALIEAGRQPPVLQVGNLQASRDFLDVADVCHAYQLLLQLSDGRASHPHCFNVSSGQSRPIADILEQLLDMSSVAITVRQDPARMRPSDISFAAGDSGLLRDTLGWVPGVPLERTLAKLLDYWRATTRATA